MIPMARQKEPKKARPAGKAPAAKKPEQTKIGVKFERSPDGFVLRATKGDITGELFFAPDGSYQYAGIGGEYFRNHADAGLSHFLDSILNGKANARLNRNPNDAGKYVRMLVSGCRSTYPANSGIIERLEVDETMRYLQESERVRPGSPEEKDGGKIYVLGTGGPDAVTVRQGEDNLQKGAQEAAGRQPDGSGKRYKTEDERQTAAYALGARASETYGRKGIELNGDAKSYSRVGDILARAGLAEYRAQFMNGYRNARRDAAESSARDRIEGTKIVTETEDLSYLFK